MQPSGFCIALTLSCLIVSCNSKSNDWQGSTSEEKPIGSAVESSAAAPIGKERAAEVCERVLGAPRRALEKSCSASEKAGKPYEYLTKVWSNQIDGCAKALEVALASGRVALKPSQVDACVGDLERSWKATLERPFLDRMSSCKGLFVGKQQQGEACASSVECVAGLTCLEGAGHTGVCSAPAAVDQGCAPSQQPFGVDHEDCASGLLCAAVGGDAAERARVAVNPFGCLQPEPGPRPDAATPSTNPDLDASLRDAQEFGMIGLLNSGGAPSYCLGEDVGLTGIIALDGIGLGNVGGAGTNKRYSISGRRSGGEPSRAPSVRMGAISVSGRLPPEVIQRIVRQNFGRFRTCYENGLRKNPDLEGKVTVNFKIERDGSTSNVAAVGDLKDADVLDCLKKPFIALTFPQPEGGVVKVSYPIMFAPPAQPATPSTSATPSSAPTTAPSSPTTSAEPAYRCVSPGSAESAGPRFANLRPQTTHDSGEPCGVLDCKAGLYCSYERDRPSKCVPLKANGAACSSSLQCGGLCVEGKCVAFCGAG
ncbi:MAG: AgmX/PglI C-terminal domain-containing protein [Polyangiaceae bacterium]